MLLAGVDETEDVNMADVHLPSLPNQKAAPSFPAQQGTCDQAQYWAEDKMISDNLHFRNVIKNTIRIPKVPLYTTD